jgi:hypothetical protein
MQRHAPHNEIQYAAMLVMLYYGSLAVRATIVNVFGRSKKWQKLRFYIEIVRVVSNTNDISSDIATMLPH